MTLHKLDALVAEHVMGIPRISCAHYSTDIAAAWEVAQMAELFTREFLILANEGASWIMCEEVNPAGCQKIKGRGVTAPIAICLAALKAKGVDVSEWERK